MGGGDGGAAGARSMWEWGSKDAWVACVEDVVTSWGFVDCDAATRVIGECCGWGRDAGRTTQQPTLSREGDQVGFINCGWLRMFPCLEAGVSVLMVGERSGWVGGLNM